VSDGGSRPRGLVVVAGLGALALIGLVAVAAFVPLGRSDPGSAIVTGHPLVDEAAPPIELRSLDGEAVSLAALRGRPVLVNFWATWCLPCRDEFPLLADAYARHAPDGLEILGIVHDDSAENAAAFAQEMGAEWPMLADPEDQAWADYLGVAMPTSFLIDAEGVVRGASLGAFTDTGLEALLRKILPEA
jgi:cytochrome c biogenesis protein CcmG/thiol:disulfide interchange protein DsbE